MTLTVTLSNTNFDLLSETDKATVYAMVSSTTMALAICYCRHAINQASGNDTGQFSFEVPDLAGGDYNIAVTVKATVWRNWVNHSIV